MGDIGKQAKSELRQLPLMLGKALGGIAAALGFGAAVWMSSHGSGSGGPGIATAVVIGCAGLVAFVFAGRRLAGRAENPTAKASSSGKKNTSLMAWGILLLLGVMFIAVSYFMTL